jgi:hypothetical protein
VHDPAQLGRLRGAQVPAADGPREGDVGAVAGPHRAGQGAVEAVPPRRRVPGLAVHQPQGGNAVPLIGHHGGQVTAVDVEDLPRLHGPERLGQHRDGRLGGARIQPHERAGLVDGAGRQQRDAGGGTGGDPTRRHVGEQGAVHHGPPRPHAVQRRRHRLLRGQHLGRRHGGNVPTVDPQPVDGRPRSVHGRHVIAATALRNGPLEQPGRRRHGHQRRHALRTGGHPAEGDLTRIPAERGDVVADPSQGGDLVQHPAVGVVEEAESPEPVVEGHHHDVVVAHERLAVADALRPGAGHVAAAVDPDEHGPRRRGRPVGSADVDVEAILADPLWIVHTGRSRTHRHETRQHGLHRPGGEAAAVPYADPRRGGQRRPVPQRTDRRLRVGNPPPRDGAAEIDAANLPDGGGDDLRHGVTSPACGGRATRRRPGCGSAAPGRRTARCRAPAGSGRTSACPTWPGPPPARSPAAGRR